MRIKEKSTNIIYVRHGQTDFPLNRIYCDRHEAPPLNDEGIKQAMFAAKILQKHLISAIYVSPAKRTKSTAEIISSQIKIPLTETFELRERDFGVWEGLYFEEIEKKFPEEYFHWKKDKAGFKPEGGESVLDMANRLKLLINHILEQNAGETVIIVSHVGPIRVLLSQAMYIPLDYYRQLRIDYGALSRVDYGASQNNIIYINFNNQFIEK